MLAYYCSDFHGSRLLFERLFARAESQKAAAVIYGGDICPRKVHDLPASDTLQKEFLSWLIGIVKDRPFRFFLIMGNDDLRVNAGLLEEADRKGILHYMHMSPKQIGPLQIVGYSFVPVTPFRLKDWEKYEEPGNALPEGALDLRQGIRTVTEKDYPDNIADDLRIIREKTVPGRTVYVFHSPPCDTKLDMIYDRRHVGSKAIRGFIEKEKPYLTLHGHIHESPRMSGSYTDTIAGTLCVNPGSAYVPGRESSHAMVASLDLLDLKSLRIEEI